MEGSRASQEGTMEILSRIRGVLTDDRFDANLICVYGTIVVVIIASLIVRRKLPQGETRLFHWPGLHWLNILSGHASRHARRGLLWGTYGFVIFATIAGIAYHLAGRDVRRDVGDWYANLTLSELFGLLFGGAALVLLFLGSRIAVRLIKRFRPAWETHAIRWIGRQGNHELLHRWFTIFERYAVISTRLLALLLASWVVGLRIWGQATFGFALCVATVLVGARLATLAVQSLSKTAADLGDRYLRAGYAREYWDRIRRLLPFGERCFEAAVYITAASLCVHLLGVTRDLGERIVECIGILFATRIVIELSQVVLNQAFGLYEAEAGLDQKGQTLVPLLHSICQYVLYFGAAVWMLGVLGLDTKPILAGAGILGLAVGFGSQNLVTDVVSGFFILFENQYLVGDYVQVGDASGIVEAVGIRLTQIRDTQGKLYILPNGQIKGVINYSKGYVNALVDLKLPAGADLEAVFRAMAEAGKRLRQSRKEVLADTEIQGIVELGTSEMTIRAVTKVHPGSHVRMQNEYRRLLRETLDVAAVTRRPAQAA
jgi:small-conductance mechanosensitive channel